MRAPRISAIYRTTVNYEAILARLNRRTQLWYEFLPYRAVPPGRGEGALQGVGESIVLAKQIEEATQWLREDIPELIGTIRQLLPELYEVMGARYPKERTFIVPDRVASKAESAQVATSAHPNTSGAASSVEREHRKQDSARPPEI